MIFKFNENLAKHIVIRQKILLGNILKQQQKTCLIFMDNVIVSIIKGVIFVKYDDNNLLYIIIIIGCGMGLSRIWCIAIIGNNTDNNESRLRLWIMVVQST